MPNNRPLPTGEIQLRFWRKLKESNPGLFDGTPHKLQYYEIVNKDILPLKIRLDIYLNEEDYRDKGYAVIRIMLPERKMKQIVKQFDGEPVTKVRKDPADIWMVNNDPSLLISEDPATWTKAIEWFTKHVKGLTKKLK